VKKKARKTSTWHITEQEWTEILRSTKGQWYKNDCREIIIREVKDILTSRLDVILPALKQHLLDLPHRLDFATSVTHWLEHTYDARDICGTIVAFKAVTQVSYNIVI
jgi:hypothetical protein